MASLTPQVKSRKFLLPKEYNQNSTLIHGLKNADQPEDALPTGNSLFLVMFTSQGR